MSREQQVIDTFVYLADTLVDDLDVDVLLHALAERCVELLDVDAAGVMLARESEQLQAVAATSRDMQQLEIFEVASTEGPSYHAYTHREAVVVHDLASRRGQWPAFTPRALELGFRSGYGFPLRLRDTTVGALNLFQSGDRHLLDGADVRLAQGFADVAAIGLLQESLLRDAENRVGQLTHALEARVIVEQAKGALAERLGAKPMEAFEIMRKHARDHNHKLAEVAEEVVTGGLDLS